MATKFAKDLAKHRKQARESCEFIINKLEAEYQKKISGLRVLLAQAKNGGGNSVSNTRYLADSVWRNVASNKTSRLFNAILEDEFELFKHIMNIKSPEVEIDQAELPMSMLSHFIGKDYRHEPRDYAEWLLDAGANPNHEGPHGYTPILGLLNEAFRDHQRYKEGKEFFKERMALLLRHGADPTQKLRIPAEMHDLQMRAGMTHLAVCDILIKNADADVIGSLEAVKALMSAKAEEKELGDELTAKTDTVKRKPGI